MARKLARKVISFEIAALRLPLAVFEETVGDRLPRSSRLRAGASRSNSRRKRS